MRNRSSFFVVFVVALATAFVALPAAAAAALAATPGANVFAYGRAAFYGSTGVARLSHPVVGIASTPSGRGYWLVARDGGMFSFGDADFHGSPAHRPHRPIVGMTSTPTGHGYRLVSDDGRVFSYGDATTGLRARLRARTSGFRAPWIGNAAIVGIAANKKTRGFWLAADGGAGAKAETAIDWFEARMGSAAYEGRCETAVELAYGTINQYDNAAANWSARTDKHTDWQHAPRGALVFYETSARGHVAISLGNGQVVSTSINHRIAVAPTGFLQRPLGWAPQPW